MHYSFFNLAFVIATYIAYQIYRRKKPGNSVRTALKKSLTVIDLRMEEKFIFGAFPNIINIPVLLFLLQA